jgi:hypothetical protein
MLKTLRFFSLLLTALSLTMESAHVLELPQKMRYDLPMYTAVNGTLYKSFAVVGGAYQILAIVLAIILAFALRGHGPSFAWSAAGAALLVMSVLADESPARASSSSSTETANCEHESNQNGRIETVIIGLILAGRPRSAPGSIDFFVGLIRVSSEQSAVSVCVRIWSLVRVFRQSRPTFGRAPVRPPSTRIGYRSYPVVPNPAAMQLIDSSSAARSSSRSAPSVVFPRTRRSSSIC